MQHKLIYAGIGSRETPDEILNIMHEIGLQLAPRWTLRSGHADGADLAFELGAITGNGAQEIFLPWKGFNGADHNGEHYIVKEPSQHDLRLAGWFHPNWGACTVAAKKLHTRNLYQVAGANLDEPVQMVICWTLKARGTGGTGQAIRIAEYLNIPVFDLADESCWEPLRKFVEQAEAWVPEITVTNRHHPGAKGEYIGRGTPLGNPYKEGTREENITHYEQWLIEQLKNGNPTVIAELDRLAELAWQGPLNLLCSCAPHPCHGDVVKRFLSKTMLGQRPWD